MGVEPETVMMAQAEEEPAIATTAQAGEEPATATTAQAGEEPATATAAQAGEEPATATAAQASVHQVMIGMVFFVQRVSLFSEVEMFNNITIFLIANHYTKDKIYFVGGPGLSISGVWNVTNVGLELGHVADSLLAWHVITGIF